jgi:PPOX class probable F420-dependent enzyme
MFITIINNARVARLDTNDSGLKPYLVPVVFVYYNDGSYYIPIDKKFKQISKLIKRVRNIEANPNVALLIDEHTEEWAKLYFIMIQGIALLMGSKSEQDQSQNHIERTRKLCPKIFLVSRGWNLGIYYNDISTKGNYL